MTFVCTFMGACGHSTSSSPAPSHPTTPQGSSPAAFTTVDSPARASGVEFAGQCGSRQLLCLQGMEVEVKRNGTKRRGCYARLGISGQVDHYTAHPESCSHCPEGDHRTTKRLHRTDRRGQQLIPADSLARSCAVGAFKDTRSPGPVGP